MDEKSRALANLEIKDSMEWCNLCIKMLGIEFQDSISTLRERIIRKILFFVSTLAIFYICASEFVFIVMTMKTSARIEEVVGLIHLWGYVILSFAKMVTLWYKRDVFRDLLYNLGRIWPVSPTEKEAEIKKNSLAGLRIMHLWYFWINMIGLWSYLLTPAVVHIYLSVSGRPSQLGSPWSMVYPFDRNTPGVSLLVFVLEVFMGQASVWATMGTDLLFSALAFHIGMLLRILHLRLCNLAAETESYKQTNDHYEDIVQIIKLHQKIIRFCQDIEDAFTLVFLINMVMSSVNLCCSGFTAFLVDQPTVLPTKLFVVASLYQIGVLCWCGDDIYHANAEVGMAAYKGGWYRCDTRCRHALRFLMLRSQKPLTFTAMKFKYLNLATYTSILTTSYSYFALLSTMYSDN